ncbi:HpcH/HpaI aldolase/citrate lyase family protein [Microbulbifer epialgicus]|uniref:CoA ester lyase n=1 Tax=Microbulbifer epialgicus TaxID=393907 RepID=A0ABV4NVK1_9GAMM
MSFYARCLLFTPGDHSERFSKAETLGADGIIIDLEDAIAEAGKDTARNIVIEYLQKTARKPSFIVGLRINSLRTPAGLRDILALIESNVYPDILMLPKTESSEEVEILNELLSAHQTPLIPLIETAKGLYQAKAIAESKNVVALLFGGADFSADLGAELKWDAMQSYRAEISKAAAAAGITAIDVPYLNLKDPDDNKLIEETRRVKELGFTCKACIHPKHIAGILKVFNPTDKEIERARTIVNAFLEAKGNACEVNGKMIDIPVVRSAKRILNLAERK